MMWSTSKAFLSADMPHSSHRNRARFKTSYFSVPLIYHGGLASVSEDLLSKFCDEVPKSLLAEQPLAQSVPLLRGKRHRPIQRDS